MGTVINSDTHIDIEQPLRISAGPGAGKTHWLILHIQDVLAYSKRMGITGKIACITYTNVGTETVVGRLKEMASRVEVCTIHSFLYNNIVKPYLHFIADEEGFDMSLLKGMSETILSDYNTFTQVKSVTKQNYVEDCYLKNFLSHSIWTFDDKGTLVLSSAYKFHKAGKYTISNSAGLVYKKLAWGKGVMSYDDVMYFSYKIFSKHPFLSKTVAGCFPYIFVDEFQDTNPIQAWLIQKLGENGSIIGVIGDVAQSIYAFAGVNPSTFTSFKVDGMQDCVIEDNHRSSVEIVDLLNCCRNDIRQTCLSGVNGEKPMLLVGDMMTCYQKAKELCGNEEVHALAYSNIEANTLKGICPTANVKTGLLDNIVDSCYERKQTVASLIRAIENATQGHFRNAVNIINRNNVCNIQQPIDLVLSALRFYKDFCDNSLAEFFSLVNSEYNLGLPMISRGAPKAFYEGHTYKELAANVNIEEDTGIQRTVHKAKGDEFENVYFTICKENDLVDFLLSPNIPIKESHRVYYVAMSRAIKRLFMNVPTLTNDNEKRLQTLPIQIIR